VPRSGFSLTRTSPENSVQASSGNRGEPPSRWCQPHQEVSSPSLRGFKWEPVVLIALADLRLHLFLLWDVVATPLSPQIPYHCCLCIPARSPGKQTMNNVS
jgi:hypothetical protein